MSRTPVTLVAAIAIFFAVVGANAFAAGSQDASTATEEPTKIVYWNNWEFPPDKDLVLAQIEERTRDTLNIDLEFNSAPAGEFKNKMNLLYASGDQFDFQFDAAWLGYTERASKGYYLDLTDLAPQHAPNWLDRLTDNEINALKFEGKLTSLGWKWPKSGRLVFIMRRDLAEKYDITDVDTLDDIEEVLAAIAGNEEGIIPLVKQPVSQIGDTIGWFNGSRGMMEIRDIGVVYDFENPENLMLRYDPPGIEGFLERMNRWYDNGYLDPNVLNNKTQHKDMLLAGKGASMIHIFGSIQTLDTQLREALPESGGAVGWPLFKDEIAALSGPDNNMFSLNRNAANPVKTLQFLNWVLESQENYDLMIYGIQGTHYVLEDGKVAWPEGVTAANNGWAEWKGHWPFRGIDTHRWKASQSDEYIERHMRNVQLNTAVPPLYGFQFVPDDTQKTTIAKWANLKAELWAPLTHGVMSPDRLSEFRQRAETIGMPELLESVQADVEGFLSDR